MGGRVARVIGRPMKLETSFDKFEPFAGAPDAVAKMREGARFLTTINGLPAAQAR